MLNSFEFGQMLQTQLNMSRKLFQLLEKQKKARENQQNNAKCFLTYRNQKRQQKTFLPGQIVLQRQLQLATGPGKTLQPKFTGPYVILSID